MLAAVARVHEHRPSELEILERRSAAAGWQRTSYPVAS